MSLESYVVEFLTGLESVTGQLAVWNSAPAIFLNRAPPDTDPGWQSGVQYPRVTFELFRSMVTKQILMGTAHLQVWCKASADNPLRTIQFALQEEMLTAALLTDEGLVVFMFQAATPFQHEKDDTVIGVDLAWNYHAYPTQTTLPPDPIWGLNTWTQNTMDPNIRVLPQPWAPSDAQPVLYWRTVEDDSKPPIRHHTYYWKTVRVQGHVICPEPYARGAWARLIADVLRAPQYCRVCLDDGSRMRIGDVTLDLDVDPMVRGQIQLEGTYRILAADVPTRFINPPNDPLGGGGDGAGGTGGGGGTPPPLITPKPILPLVFSPQFAWVSDIDTGQLLYHLHLKVRSADETGTTPLEIEIPFLPLDQGPDTGTVGESATVVAS